MFKKKPLDLDPRILKRLFRQENDVQVMVYWEDHYEVLVALLLMEEDVEVVKKAILLLSESLNNREKYTWTAFIYHKLYVAKNRFLNHPCEMLDNIKFQLGKGLHFSRQYAEAKRLFDDLNRVESFDHSSYEDWYEHTAASSKREEYLDTNSFLLPLSKLLFSLLYLVLIATGFFPVFMTIGFVILALALQFSYYWDKTAAHFGTFRKHKEEVKYLKQWIFGEGSVMLTLTFLAVYTYSASIISALLLVVTVWLGALLFNLIFLKRLRKRITLTTS